ncbi:hypothetical protein niasHT_007384 [Heterodera trifolii]|uniref:Cadherin domain-containing protein n=1 Tax=Heterodera trifolii TaxID=157864 RepID=A0ABD2LLN5_9BILA
MEIKRDDQEKFRRCRLFASPISSLPSRANEFDRPFFLLTPSSASSSTSSSSSASSSSAAFSSSSLPPSVRLRLVPPFADHLLHVQMSILPLIPSNFPSSSSSSIAIPRRFPLGLPFLQIQLHFHPQLVAIVVSNAPHFSPRFQLQLISPADDYASSSSASSSTSSSASSSVSSSSSSASSASSFTSSSSSSTSSSSSSSDFVLPFLHLCPLSGLLSLQTHSVASDYAIEVIVEDEWTGAKGSKRLELHFLDDSEQSDRMMNFIRQNLSMNFNNYSSNSFSVPAFLFWVAENAAIGTIVGQFDQKLVNEQTKLIRADGMPFALNIKNGTLTVIGPIDAEKASLFSFHLKSDFDDAIELLRIDVHVRDENEHLPTVEGAGDALLVAENIPIGGRILRIDMRDEDRTSELVAFVDQFLTDEHNAFFVDEKGWLKVGAKLDRERREEYQVIIRLMDAKPPKKVLFSSLILNVSVTDVNDCAPQFPAPFLDFFVDENSPPGTVFSTILATDQDKGENGTVRYRMVGDCPDQLALDPLFGYLTVIGAIDRELLTGPMEFVVEAFDLGVLQQRSAVKVRVHVVDQDDNRPEPEQQHVEMALIEGTPAGDALIRLSYKDTDEGSNAVALFAIVKGTKSNGRNGAEKELIDDQFHIGAFSGVLSVAMPLDESIQANDTIHLNISMTAFTGRWPPSFISVSLLVVRRTASSPPPSLLFQHVRLFLHPLITFPFVFHRIAPPQPNCSFVLLNQSRLFSLHTVSGLGFVRLLRLPPSDRLPSSTSSSASDSDRSFALSVLVSSPSLSSASVLLTLVVHFSSPFSSASLLLSPPVQFVRIDENKSLFWELKVNADQTEEGQIGDGGGRIIRYKMMEEYCEEEGKTEEKEGNREEEDERAADDEETANGTTQKQHKRQFEIDPIDGIVRSRTELSAKRSVEWQKQSKSIG